MSFVDLTRTVDVNVLTIVILAVIVIAVRRNQQDRRLLGTRLFTLLISLNILMAIIDILGWVWESQAGPWARVLNTAANTLLFMCVPLPAIAWFMYAHYHVFGSVEKLRRALPAVLAVFAANGMLTLISLRTGWFFSVSQANHYSRGPWFMLHMLSIYGLLLATLIMIVINRKRVEPAYYRALVLFIIPPVTGVVLQNFFFGLAINWASMMLSILIVYLWVQDRGLHTDFLTGTYNRRHFEKMINSKIQRISRQGFSVIIADLDDFKKINDQYGHDIGDEALLKAVQLIRQCLRRNDLVARFGGDEFYLLLDIDQPEILNRLVRRIQNVFEQHEQTPDRPYRLAVSMGASVYDPDSGESADQFLKRVDHLMYQEKSRRRHR